MVGPWLSGCPVLLSLLSWLCVAAGCAMGRLGVASFERNQCPVRIFRLRIEDQIIFDPVNGSLFLPASRRRFGLSTRRETNATLLRRAADRPQHTNRLL